MGIHSRLSIHLVTDDPARSRRLSALLGQRFHVETDTLDSFDGTANGNSTFVIDIDLSNPHVIARIKDKVSRHYKGRDKYYVIDDGRRTDLVQANSLGARDVIRKSSIERDAALLVNKLNQGLMDGMWQDQTPDMRVALTSINTLNDSLYTSVSMNIQLPQPQVLDCCEFLITNLEDQGIAQWLDAVRQHHSYTYRHSMTVSGLAVCFALALGMRRSDVERIAIGALMHDVGKMRMPLGLLDKPGALDDAERRKINLHPEFGAEILRADGQFDDEVIDIALYHHEFLDGSGYPFGLDAGRISDPVRIMTVVDIFAALIDDRSYKEAVPCEQAYAILTGMDGKLDQDIVRAFEPTAIGAAPDTESVVRHAAAV